MGSASRESFSSSVGVMLTMIGVTVGLGNIWRFPYMVGRFGGAAFVLLYVAAIIVIGVPALMTEWTLGRSTRLGTVGAFARAGLPLGRWVGWLLFAAMLAGIAYYTNVIGWVLFYALGEMAGLVGLPWDASAILPPDEGFVARSFFLQMAATGIVLGACALVVLRGLRSGIEPVSKIIMPTLLVILVILIVRSLTLPGAGAGVHWFILKIDFSQITPSVMIAALGQAVFSLSLGGMFMVVYGSYLGEHQDLRATATWTAIGDTTAGLLAGLAIFPAVFAFGLEPGAGPVLLFSTLPQTFAAMPAGGIFGLLFFSGLLGAAYLSDVAGFEVVIAGLTDNTKMTRVQAVWLTAGLAFLLAMLPMINTKIFVPWDLTFGSGAQTVGALLAVLTVGWALKRSAALRQLSTGGEGVSPILLYYWIRFVVPGAILGIGIWWMLTRVLGVIRAG